MATFNIILSKELDEKLHEIVQLDKAKISEILRKSLYLYLVARVGTKKGMKLYLVDSMNENNNTEIIGL